MKTHATAGTDRRGQRRLQTLKWIVYTLLILNFFYYIYDDWTAAMHTLHAGSTIIDWTSAFATTIDETGWFVLLAMFEL